MMWEELGTALALILVLEGIMPFLNPAGLRKTLKIIVEMDDKTLRKIGFISMIVGVTVLYWVR